MTNQILVGFFLKKTFVPRCRGMISPSLCCGCPPVGRIEMPCLPAHRSPGLGESRLVFFKPALFQRFFEMFFMRSLLILLCFVGGSSNGHCQLGIPRAVDPASFGMGGIFQVDGSRYQPLGNPAILGDLKQAEIGAFIIQPFGLSDLAITYAHGALHAGTGGFGAGMGYSGVNGYRAIAMHAGFGHKLWKRLMIGIGMDGYYLDFADYGNSTSLGLTGGLVFPFFPGLNMGVLLRYPFSVSFAGNDNLPVTYQATLSYNVSSSVQLAAEWVQEPGFSSDIRIGLSYSPLPQLPIRLGYQSLANAITAGIGYTWNTNWVIDIAAGHHPYLGFTPTAGFRYKFSS